MSLAELIPLLLRASIVGMVFSIGLRTTFGEATTAFRRPAKMLKGGVAMFVIMPLVAVGLIKALDPLPPTGLVLVAAALSPVPPLLPNKEMKAGAGAAQAVGLMVGASLLAIVLIPFGVSLIGSWFGMGIQVPHTPALNLVLATILVPLSAGVLFKTLAPAWADQVAAPLAKAATVLLLVAVVPVLIRIGPAMWAQVGGLTVLAFILFVVIGIVIGHVLGADNPDFQTVLAVSTPSRHPALAAALAGAVMPGTEGIVPAVVLYLLICIIVTGVYLALRKKRQADHEAVAA